MTSVDNHSWLSLQTYVIDDWSKIPIMVSLQRLLKGARFWKFHHNHHFCLIASSLASETLSSKLICLGGDSVSVFQGATIGVTWQIQVDYVPHM
jgi:hypothetical protein